MKVLISIHPDSGNKIFDGTKKYEFRRVIFKNDDISKVVVYCSAPVQKLIGEFEVEEIIKDTPANIWRQTYKDAGISKEYFIKYFYGKTTGYAIKVKNPVLYKEPLCLRATYHVQPPQNFCYVGETTAEERAALRM